MAKPKYVHNPFTNKLDATRSNTDLDARYLKLDASNDPVTGELELSPGSGNTALKANKDIVLKLGWRLYFDGQ